jgi:hypothetical protein
MGIPPKRLDGAVVVHYVTLSTRYPATGASKHVVDGHIAEPPLALAICQYAGGDGAYLFYCGSDWNVITDDLCGSVLDAFRHAERQFEGLTESEWSTAEDSAHEAELAQREEAAALNALPDDYATEDTIRRLVGEGRDVEAILRLRRARGQSLLEAHTLVSRIKKQLGK